MTERDILQLIAEDDEMMHIIRLVEPLQLPQWAIGAGFVRNKVWNVLHDFVGGGQPTDIDVVYFDPLGRVDSDPIEQQLLSERPDLEWEVRNQALMHGKNDMPPYQSTEDALSKWPETATAIGVTMQQGELKLIAPHGIGDLTNLIVRPTPTFMDPRRLERVRERVQRKRWLEKWPKLKTIGI